MGGRGRGKGRGYTHPHEDKGFEMRIKGGLWMAAGNDLHSSFKFNSCY